MCRIWALDDVAQGTDNQGGSWPGVVTGEETNEL
jgi:hypothetical protein